VAHVQDVLSTVSLQPFVPSSSVVIKTDETDEREEGSPDDPIVVQKLLDELPAKAAAVGSFRLNPVKFEKDNDANFHVDFALAATNLRATNYGIELADRLKVKSVAGRIVPAMATTTAMVTGFVLLEMYKLVRGEENPEKYRNGACDRDAERVSDPGRCSVY